MEKKLSKLVSKKSSRYSGIPKLKSMKFKYNDKGVDFVKENYAKYNGQELYDHIYPNLFYIPNTLKDLSSKLGQVYEHGNSIEQVKRTVTAKIPGLHVYKLANGKVIGIVMRQPVKSNASRKSKSKASSRKSKSKSRSSKKRSKKRSSKSKKSKYNVFSFF